MIKKLYDKFWHWMEYRNRPTIHFDLNDTPSGEMFARIYHASKAEHGDETPFLDHLCKHYNCEFCIGSECKVVLDFQDNKLYTTFILKYGEYL